MIVDQLEQRYDLKVDLGNYQTGTVEFYVQANLDTDAGADVDAANTALQDMATRNVKTYASKLRPAANGKPAPDVELGIDFPGLTITKIGVGFGKKLKIGNGFGVSNRDIFGRIWGQLEPDEAPSEAAKTLWGHAVRAYEGKMASLAPAKSDEDEPENTEQDGGNGDDEPESEETNAVGTKTVTVPLNRKARLAG